MSNTYAGLPAVARQYWREYFTLLTGTAVFLLFTGSITAVLVLSLLPDAIWYFIFASASLAIHFSALFLRDVWAGEYEPSQTTYSSARDVLAVIAVVGTWATVILSIGTFGGYLLAESFGLPVVIAGAFSAYYPVVDTLIMRRERLTPGAGAMVVTIILITTAINLHRSVIDLLPVIGRREGPHS